MEDKVYFCRKKKKMRVASKMWDAWVEGTSVLLFLFAE